jgi:hypothetical protein
MLGTGLKFNPQKRKGKREIETRHMYTQNPEKVQYTELFEGRCGSNLMNHVI